MAQDNRDILDILRFELSFLQDGGYGRSPRAPWRAPAIFEDSPICPNFCDPLHPNKCEQCLLAQFVPAASMTEEIPCRFIPLTAEGQTVEDLYRMGSQDEMEKALEAWLRAKIENIERDRGLSSHEGAA
jgi:hypothetical protein